MTLAITPIYAAALTVVFLVLMMSVILMRVKTKTSLFHGDDLNSSERIRRHANFTETVPLALILLAMVEVTGGPSTLVHGVGVRLLAGRIIHPIGIVHDNAAAPMQIVGTVMTQATMLICAGYLVFVTVGG
jgi:uncharacterized protein